MLWLLCKCIKERTVWHLCQLRNDRDDNTKLYSMSDVALLEPRLKHLDGSPFPTQLIYYRCENSIKLFKTKRPKLASSPHSWKWNASGRAWGAWAGCRVCCSSEYTRDSGDRLWPRSAAACYCCTGTIEEHITESLQSSFNNHQRM